MVFRSNKFPEFDLGDVLLREINPKSDSKDFYSYIRKKNVSDFIPDSEVPKTLDASVQELEYWASLFLQRRSIFWGIEHKETKKFIGMVGCNSFSDIHNRVEISYDLDYNFWGLGIMKKSLTRVIVFLRSDLGVVRVQATVAEYNERSIGLLEATGFKREGMLMKYAFLGGKCINYYMYANV